MNAERTNSRGRRGRKVLRLMLVDANSSWLAREGGKSAQVVLPLGLMYLSAAVKRAFGSGVEVRLLNMAIDCDSQADYDARVAAFAPDVVGFRSLSAGRGFFYELARQTRELCPGAVLIAGGPHATLWPREVLEQTPIDFVVVGEGERTLVELLEHLAGRRELDELTGLRYRRGGAIRRTPPAEYIQDLDALPWPDYDAIDLEAYARVLSYGYTMRRQGVVLTSRGCPFSCRYCFKLMGRRYRPRDPLSVADEIEHLQKDRGIRDILFVDDTFNLQADRVEAIFRELRRRKLQANYYFPAGLRADLMTPALIDLLVEAGTCWITYAVETVVPRIMRLAGRTGDVEKMAEIIDYTVAKRIMVGLFSMVGFPTETREEAMTTLEYIRRRRATMPFFFAVKYFPGTGLTKLALAQQAITPEIVEQAASAYHDVSGARTSTMSQADFQELFMFYMKDILMDRPRLTQALEVQERFLQPHELAAAYSALLNRKITDPRRTFRFALQKERS